ncbi:MAG: beta-1,6-glucan synthase, partial [Rhodocyclaceae bacterium]|nr:beta-1,6-glucan synthase [Rhodocyclaceae bacterium]
MNSQNQPRAARTCALVFALALLALAVWLWKQAQPVTMPDLQLDAGERLACVSYSPFHLPGQTPLNPHAFIPPAQIRADLAALAERAACVRIYSTDQGLDAVLPAARELGLKVILGAWLGVDTAANERALTRAIELANANTDVVDVLMVGNEVLLRQEQTPAQMMAWLQRAKAQSRVPVSYA